MTTDPATIDLGELPRGQPGQVEPQVAWPVWERLRRWHNRRRWRPAGAVTVTVLLLWTVAAAAAPPEPVLQYQFTVPQIVEAAVGRQHLYTIETPPGVGPTLVAYRLDGGALAWERPLPAGTDSTRLSVRGGNPMVHTYSSTAAQLETVTVFDPHSGAPRWSREGVLFGVVDGLVLLSRDDYSTGEVEVAAVDPATGRAAWTFTLATGVYTTDRNRLVTLEPDGTLSSYNLTTGEPLATVQTPARPTEANLRIAGPVVYIVNLIRGRLTLTWYDVDALTERWSVELGTIPDGRTDHDYHFGSWPVPCGSLVCLMHEAAVPQAFDPATGQLVWSASWLPTPDAGTWFGIQNPQAEPLAGHLVLSMASEGGRARSWLVDSWTGESVLDVRGWHFAYPGEAPESGLATPMLTWDGQTAIWFGRLRADLSAVDPIGAIAHPHALNCALHPPYVLCRTYRGESGPQDVDVWLARW